jgi:DNA-binding Xre family transcriptional regulator
MSKKIVTTKELAEILGIHIRSVVRLAAKNSLKMVGRNRFDLEESLKMHTGEIPKENSQDNKNNATACSSEKQEKEIVYKTQPIRDLVVNKNELAEALGIAHSSVSDLHKKNIFEKTDDGYFNLVKSVRAYQEHLRIDFLQKSSSSKDRKEAAESELKEIELQIKKKELISLSDIYMEHEELIREFENAHRTFSQTVVPKIMEKGLCHQDDIGKIKDVIDKESFKITSYYRKGIQESVVRCTS